MRGNKQQAIQDLQKAVPILKAQNNTVGFQMVVKVLQQLQK